MIEVCTGAGAAWLNRYRGRCPAFACVLSFTETALIADISAAGATAQARRVTAAADGAYLIAGADSKIALPSLPAGVSPAVISRAVLQHFAMPCHLLSTGLPVDLPVDHIALPRVTANTVQTGKAMPVAKVRELLAAGLHWGARLALPNSYLIIGECVVGGTTTAQAVLEGLGYEVAGCMSSSHRRGNHVQKRELAQRGLAIGYWPLVEKGSASVIDLLAAVGDPMQPVVIGMLLAASCCGGVLLAGGAQMLAMYAGAQALARQEQMMWRPDRVAVGTTRWVIEDGSADTVAIAQKINASYLASQINFSQSPYFQLRAYEQGFVKEGVGAGGCAISAHLYQGWTRSQLRHAVEAQLRLS